MYSQVRYTTKSSGARREINHGKVKRGKSFLWADRSVTNVNCIRLAEQTSVLGLALSHFFFFYLNLRFTCLVVLLGPHSRSICHACFHSSCFCLCHIDTQSDWEDKNCVIWLCVKRQTCCWGCSLCADVDACEIPISISPHLSSAAVQLHNSVYRQEERTKYARAVMSHSHLFECVQYYHSEIHTLYSQEQSDTHKHHTCSRRHWQNYSACTVCEPMTSCPQGWPPFMIP